MDLNYLSSVIDFYLKNETDDNRANLNIAKEDNKAYFSFGMNGNESEKSIYETPLHIINNHLSDIINLFKQDLMIIDEKYDLNNESNICYYCIKLKNGRIISFEGFSIIEINKIRNLLYNVTLNKDEIRVDLRSPNEISMNYEPRLQETGYTSFSQLFLLVLFVSDIVAVGLWIFVTIMK